MTSKYVNGLKTRLAREKEERNKQLGLRVEADRKAGVFENLYQHALERGKEIQRQNSHLLALAMILGGVAVILISELTVTIRQDSKQEANLQASVKWNAEHLTRALVDDHKWRVREERWKERAQIAEAALEVMKP
jgi:hypothetical protein